MRTYKVRNEIETKRNETKRNQLFVDFVSFRFVFVDFVSFRFVSFLFRFALYRYALYPHFACLSVTVLLTYITRNSIQAGFACRQTFRSSNVIFLFVFVCVSVFMNYKVSGVDI
jgi:signal transduction histidine kinase